jgi:Domain of unknown function (DUF6089)
MKLWLALLLFISHSCIAQKWDAEIMQGLSGYNGDLTDKLFSSHTFGPATGFNLKYNLNYIVSLRGGIMCAGVSGNDKYDKQEDLKKRNLNFRTNIVEANLCIEFNLLEPEYFTVYPYLFAGIGVFHFNPYTYDKNAHRVYLQPLGTEGQGLADYPDREPYSLTQFCIPFGGGIKMNLTKKFDLVYELSGRYLFTDYLDDVSKTYVNPQMLMTNSRPETAELAYRQAGNYVPCDGDIRGNPQKKDWYYVTGLKLLMHLGKE